MVKTISILILLVAMTSAASPQNTRHESPADVMFIHGNIYTGTEAETSAASSVRATVGAAKRSQAIAIRGDRILAIGSDDEIDQFRGPNTTVVDLAGHFVMPGFNDAHMHLASAGLEKLNVDLVGAKDIDDFRARLRARVQTTAPGEWISGGGWDETLWPVKVVPTRKDLDDITGGHPVLLSRIDGHIAVANTRALVLAGIIGAKTGTTKEATKDPAGGKIDRDSSGAPTGILREQAVELAREIIPAPSHDKCRHAIELALADLARHGITSAQDFSDWQNFKIYEELEAEGKLTARISEWLPFYEPLDVLQRMRASHPASDPMLHTGMLKAFMDGSLGSRTAALLAPYSDDPGNSGLPQYSPDKLNAMTKERLLAGYQIGFHAIGDKGVQMALDAFAGAEKAALAAHVTAADGTAVYRLRVEHAQVTTPEQIARFKELNVIASMQPSHLLTDMNWADSRLGPERAATSYAWAEFLRHGVTLAFGTDYPVEPVTPFRGIYAALTRMSEDGRRTYPGHTLTIDGAITAYTTGAAYAEFAEKEKGKLAPGMLADFVVLDQDITAVPPHAILATRVLHTVVGGKTVYEPK